MKNTIKKTLSLLLVLLMLFAVVAGCGAKEDEVVNEGQTEEEATEFNPAETQIGICIGSMNHPVHRIAQMGFLEKADEMGYIGIVSGMDEGSTQEIIAKWESAITNGMAGAMIWTGDDSMYNFMREYTELCPFVVPHFAHNYQDTKDFISRNVCCLAADYGVEVAKYILEELAERGITEGTIGLTQASPNVTENACADSFRNYINQSGTAFTVLPTVFEGVEVIDATNKVSAVIQANQDTIVAGFGTTGGSAQSWNAAMENTSMTHLVVVGVDYVELNLNLVEEGAIQAIVCQPLYDEAQVCAESLDALLRGEDFTGSEEEWFVKLDAPLAKTGTDLSEYRNIVSRVKDFFND